MKKTSLFVIFIISAAVLQAQVLYDQHMSLPQNLKDDSELSISFDKLFQKQIRDTEVSVIDIKEFKKDKYTTSEFFSRMFHDEPAYTLEDGYDVEDPLVEQKETRGYVEVTFRIPPQYEILPDLNEYGRFQDSFHDCVNIFFIDDFRLFKLDYKITLEKPELQKEIDIGEFDELSKNQFQNKEVAKIIKIRYSPRYFTLEKNYPYEKNVPNKHGFNVEIRPIFSVQKKGVYALSFYLVPNVKNIYRDFKFMKEGPSPYIYEKIKEEPEEEIEESKENEEVLEEEIENTIE